MRILFLLALFSFSVGCNRSKVEHNQDSSEEDLKGHKDMMLTLEWMTHGLDHVESVLYDQKKNVIYATNGKDKLEGTNGFISKISITGKILELNWVKGLIRPTGMALDNNKLYVADVNALLIIDTDTGEILEQIKEPVEHSGLNDVAITDEGEIFVTASSVHAVLKVTDGKLVVFAVDVEKLEWANGIIAEKNKLLIAGENLSSVDIKSKIITSIPLHPVVNDFDGIASDGSGGYFLSTVEKSALWHLNAQHHMKPLMNSNEYVADLEFIPALKMVLVARGNIPRNRYFIAAYAIR